MHPISIIPATIHQELAIAIGPDRIYDALLSAKAFTARSGGAPATIDPTEGGAFSLFGGHITGRNLELLPYQRIVQAWRAKTWREGDFSIVKFVLVPEGTGTQIVFDHVGFPPGEQEHLEKGWHENYWNPLKRTLEGAHG
ncbi:MAG: SRPBCC domain-containing protein [Flavobacteriales bacterium]